MQIEMNDLSTQQLVLNLSGEMDALGCSKIRPRLEKVTDLPHPHIVMDVSQVSFMDSSGIGAIVFLFKRLKQQQRTIEIVGVHGQPKDLMKLLRIDSAIALSYVDEQEVQHG
ncbi:STAS domain-containing protein [Motilimonas pumila]|uniref:Anti-sigma factor antagonist n=1 Tax=Motilimonas pumila TaxID=2303987 RepID=A0A418YD82_9GAMM|nr:STAS domain-containing protein [Motilimonas pumila]RJG42463.1 anti-sigma factor antagonist [Motilimonas pumila]